MHLVRKNLHLLFMFVILSCMSCGKSVPVDKSLASITISSSVTTLVGAINSTQQITAIGTYTDGTTADVSSFITWSSSSTSVVTVSTSGLATAVAPGTSNITATSVNSLQNSVIVTSNTLTLTVRTAYAYISRNAVGSSVSKCNVSMTGLMDINSCATTGVASVSEYRQIAINGNYAYVVDKNAGTVTYCSIGSDGSWTACGTAISGFGANEIYGLGFKNGYAFLQNRATHHLLSCPINSDGKTFGTCTTALSSGLTQPYYIIIQGNYLYATNYIIGAITKCTINTNGTLSACTTSSTLANGAFGLRINGNYIYIADHGNAMASKVLYCALNSDLSMNESSCTATGGAFDTPTGINLIGNYAYIFRHGSNILNSCTVNSDGSLSNCAPLGAIVLGVDIVFY